jgi:hypothetical protein
MPLRCAILILLLVVSVNGLPQQITQQIRGVVLEKDSRRPLPGASVSLADDTLLQTVLSDGDGKFILAHVPVGRHRVQCSFSGYDNFITENIIVNSSREQELVIEMEQRYLQQTGVYVKSVLNPKLPVNRLMMVSSRSFTAEETGRYAASVNDPGRMAMSFPGVQPTRDARSDIIIRGNSAAGLLWRLEGIDIPNPNHFARKGSSGGGITIFSSSMLDNSDFSSGAFPAEYGDALSGVFDMHFRKGNNEKNHYTFKAGLIGIDLSAEGPVKKEKSSFLLNYRYSTLGILNAMGFHLTGEREDNNFQDLSFNLSFASKNDRSVLNIWGIGGLSQEDYAPVKNVNDWDEYDDYAVYDFKTNMGAMGVRHRLNIGKQSSLSTSLAVMGQQIIYVDDTLNRQKAPFNVNNEQYKNSRVSFALSLNTKPAKFITWKTGLFGTRISYSFMQSLYDFDALTYRNNIVQGNGNSFQWQPYTQFNFKIGPKWTANAGIHVLFLALNNTHSVEPRLSLQYRVRQNHTLGFALGKYSKTLPLGSYFYQAPDHSQPNRQLDFMKSAHFVFSYDWLMKKNWRLHVEAYLQKLTAIPVVNDLDRTFWLLNMIDGYANESLVSSGTGRNKGVDITLEKFFSKNWFLLSSFSIFSSTYSPLNGKTYNTQYNSRNAGSLTMGREWKKKNNKTFTLGGKALYNGGMPISPLLPGSGVNSREPQLDETRPYSEYVPAYFRVDTRVSLRKDRAKKSWVLSLDIQNILGIMNTDALSRRFDPAANQWRYKKLSGLVPVISYQIDF